MRDPIDPRAEPEIEFTRWTEQLRTDLAQSVGGTLLRGARPVPVDSQRNQPTSVAGALVGFSVMPLETPVDSMLALRDRDGNLLAAGRVVDAAGDRQVVTEWFGPGGINIPDGGLFVFSEADFEGVVYLRGAD